MYPIVSSILRVLLAPIILPVYYGASILGLSYSPGGLHPSDWASDHGATWHYLTTYCNRPTRPLPATRQRRLTLPLPPQSSSMFAPQQKTNDQVQSLLFCKLPVEIRMTIYEKALGGEGRLLHIVRATEDSFSHIRFTKLDRKCNRYECCKMWTPDAEDPKRRGTFHKTHGHLLPLLMSCRKAYTEAIDVLYRVNVFEFRDHYPFICFPTTILPARMSEIRNLQFTFMTGGEFDYCAGTRSSGAPSGAVAWRKVWEIVAGMSGLRDLQVELIMRYQLDAYDASHMDQLLLPLMAVQQTKRFVVGVWWTLPNDYYLRDLSKQPFQVVEMREIITN